MRCAAASVAAGILLKLAAAARAMLEEIGARRCTRSGETAASLRVARHNDTRDVRPRPRGSGSDQVADPATDLGVPVGMQLGDRGVTDQPGSG